MYKRQVGYSDCEACQNSQSTPTPTPTVTPTPTATPTPTPTPTPATDSYKVAQIDLECQTTTNYFYIPIEPSLTTNDVFKIRDSRGTILSGCYKWTGEIANVTPNSSLYRFYFDCISCLYSKSGPSEFQPE